MLRATLLLLILLATPAMAQTAIHRCVGANGGAVFTDQPCAALQATPVSAAPRAEASTTIDAPPPQLCAADPEALRQSVIAAFAARNGNRLAGLMLWRGYGRGTAIADIRSLSELVKQPLLDVALPGDDDSGTDMLTVQLAANDGSGAPAERRFGIVREAGCLWLRNDD